MKILVYHGSKNNIQAFDSKNQVSGYYPGFYTTTDLNLAKSFGKILYSMTIDGSKFYQLSDADELKANARKAGYNTSSGSGYNDVKFLQDLGYQGIQRGIEYIIFNPSLSAKNFQQINSNFKEWIKTTQA